MARRTCDLYCKSRNSGSAGLCYLPAAMILGDHATPEAIEKLREAMDLNKPLYKQMFEWFSRVIRGDMGQSIFIHRSVNSVIFEHLEASFLLSIMSMFMSVILGVIIGVIAAV